MRAFPNSAPVESIALVGSDGHELAWIERLSDLRAEIRALLEEELASRDFVPEILRLRHVSSFATPSTWEVETDRGDTVFVLKGEEDIRRLGRSGLLIADRHGIQFLVRDLSALDHASSGGCSTAFSDSRSDPRPGARCVRSRQRRTHHFP